MADHPLPCVMCDWIVHNATEEQLEEQRRELEYYNTLRHGPQTVASPRPLPHPPSNDGASSMYTDTEHSFETAPAEDASPSSPEQDEPSTTPADIIESLRKEITEERLRGLYWQHQFTQDHAKHATAFSQIKRLESDLFTANEKLDTAERRVQELEAELEMLRRSRLRRNNTTGSRALVGGPRDMERLASLLELRPSSR
ncbi:hypothetical protein NMY22_g13754 [Coprinellus aureogranulatus]|nr:hypothetical protein NMY22_g13754 [Coprinellus aureogranulatus]